MGIEAWPAVGEGAYENDDYSLLSIEQALEYNRNAVAAGRCVVKQGDASALELDTEKKTYTAEQIADALKAAGFLKVKIFHHRSKPWIAALARK